MREPSIHITLSQFEEIIKSLDIREVDVQAFFKKARPYSIVTRSILKGNNKKNQQKLNNIQKASMGDASLLADIIYAARIKAHQVGVTKINQGSAEWLTLKNLAHRLQDFNQLFEYKTREGYIKFVEIGLNKYKNIKGRKLALVRFLDNQYDLILEEQQVLKEIEQDDDPENTLMLYQLFTATVLDKTGISNNYKDNPLEYIHFLYARKLADKLGVDYETFLEAQFEALAFFGGIPKLSDLYNEKAQERLTKYISRNGINLNARSLQAKSQSIDWGAFKK